MILNIFHKAREHLEPICVPFEALVVERFDFMLGEESFDVKAFESMFSTYRELVDDCARPPAMLERHICLEFRRKLVKKA